MATRLRPFKKKTKVGYVGNQQGWKILFFSLSLAAIFGLSLRLYFSPEMIAARLRHVFNQQKQHYVIDFKTARLQLSRGAIPQIAIVLSDVSFVANPTCEKEPSIQMDHLTVPFRFLALLQGQLQAGDILSDEVKVDLDRLRRRCETSAPESSPPLPNLVKAPSTDLIGVRPWWTHEQFIALQSLVSRVDFGHVELGFESHREQNQAQVSKKVSLRNLALSFEPDDEGVRLRTYLQVSPEVTYGEQLPPLLIDVNAKASTADLSVKADLSEGALEILAKLRPASNSALEIEAKAAVSELPLSTTGPLLSKTGLVKGVFHPKFLWLNCNASIKGRFQGLFVEEPLFIERCALEGQGSEIRVDSAMRSPNGQWSPFKMSLRNLDLRKVLETFGAKGPDGIASDFGRVTGGLDVESKDEANFTGVLEGAQVHFSSRNLRAVQGVNRMEMRVAMHGTKMIGEIKQIDMANGQFKGELRFDSDREFRDGKIKIHLDAFSLDPNVQKVLVNGVMSPSHGDGEATLRDGKLASVGGDWYLDELKSSAFRLFKAHFRTEYDGGDVRVNLKAPLLELRRDAKELASWRALFFRHEFETDWVPVNDILVRATVSDVKGVQWDKASASMEDRKIALQTGGSLSRDHRLSGWVGVDFPRLKKLKWLLSGTDSKPVLSAEFSPSKFENADDLFLGLMKKKRSVRATGASVMKGAGQQMDQGTGDPETDAVVSGE